MHSSLATAEQGAGGLDCELLCAPAAEVERGCCMVMRMAGGISHGSRSPGGVRRWINPYMPAGDL